MPLLWRSAGAQGRRRPVVQKVASAQAEECGATLHFARKDSRRRREEGGGCLAGGVFPAPEQHSVRSASLAGRLDPDLIGGGGGVSIGNERQRKPAHAQAHTRMGNGWRADACASRRQTQVLGVSPDSRRLPTACPARRPLGGSAGRHHLEPGSAWRDDGRNSADRAHLVSSRSHLERGREAS